MEKVKVSLENCYGIRKMDAEFDFTKKFAQLIYAPNGAMKSSFATTFKDHGTTTPSRDRIYTDRETKRSIVDHEDKELAAETVFVIEPYDARYQCDRVATLLVNKDLKAEYDDILRSIQQKQDALITKLKKTSGVRSGLEEILSVVITKKPDNLLPALYRVRSEVKDDPFDKSLEGIRYASLFNDKVEGFLADPDMKAALEDYTASLVCGKI